MSSAQKRGGTKNPLRMSFSLRYFIPHASLNLAACIGLVIEHAVLSCLETILVYAHLYFNIVTSLVVCSVAVLLPTSPSLRFIAGLTEILLAPDLSWASFLGPSAHPSNPLSTHCQVPSRA